MSEFQILARDVLVACILLGLTALVGLVGNGLMLRALVLYPKLRTEVFIVLGSVAAADILCLVISVPMHIIYLTMTTDPVTDAWCKASKYLDVGSGFVAAYGLVVLTVVRGILLISRGHNPPTPRQSLLCVLLLCLIAFLAAIPFPMMVEDIDGYCHYTIDTNIEKEVWLLNSFACFVPVVLILFIYLFTHMVSQRYFEDSYSYREKQLSKLVSVIVAVSVLLQLPFRALDTFVMYKEMEAELMDFPDGDTLESLYIARNYLLCLMMADKAVRPIICSQLAPDLSGAFDEVINCTLCQRLFTRAGSGSGSGSGRGDSTGRRGERRSGRYPSTSSNAPLYNASEGENPDTVKEEMEIVAL